MTIGRHDIVVAGGGYTGICAAVAIRMAAPDLDVRVVDASPECVWRRDGRASAIAAGAGRMLAQLGVWPALEDEAQPVTGMIVTDSSTNDPVRPVLLTFGGEAAPGEPFAHMVPNRALVGALREAADRCGVSIEQDVSVTGFEVKDEAARLELSNGQRIAAQLLVAADGVRSKLREMAGIRAVHHSYGQSAIVATVVHDRPHNGRAEEHFLPAGPFAILPLTGNRSSLVWTERTGDAERLMASDDLVFGTELERRFGHRLGALELAGEKRMYPLGLTLVRDFVRPRIALCGDAAHGIHPVAGQGLNLGLRDVAALAETVVDAHRLGLDAGSLTVLERYQVWRRFDTFRMGVTCDLLNRLFSNDRTLNRAVRGFGLRLVDRLPSLKTLFIRQASGISGPRGPRLLRGEAI